MYYSYPCPVCGKIFYTFSDYKQQAAQTLYNGIEKHMKDYTENKKDYVLDHPDKMYQDVKTVYSGMMQSTTVPPGEYNLD